MVKFVAEVSLGRAVFDIDDRFVVKIDQQVVGRGRAAGNVLGMCVIARAGDVAEEVRLALGARYIQRRRLGTQSSKQFGERFFDRSFGLGEALAGNMTETGLLEIGELL